jgi:hypothetical protein
LPNFAIYSRWTLLAIFAAKDQNKLFDIDQFKRNSGLEGLIVTLLAYISHQASINFIIIDSKLGIGNSREMKVKVPGYVDFSFK